MQKFVPDMLQEINDNLKLLDLYKNDATLKLIFSYAFDPANKFDLPEGDPPYKEDAAPIGMSPAIFKQELKKLYVFCRKDLKPARRELIFIQLLENIHPTEAKVLLAIKDQKLTKLYKKITHKAVYEAGFITNPPPEKKKAEPKVKEELETEKK